jgi:D-alanine-D-alanine ligase
LTVPADVAESIAVQVRDIAIRSFEALECEGLARVDFFVQPNGSIVVNEVNTMPGFTPNSMFPRMWAHSGVSYAALIDRLLQLALHRDRGLR